MGKDKIINFRINLDRENAVYFPGETVSGTLSFTVQEDIRIEGILVKFSGKAKVRWTESEMDGDSTKDVTYKNKRTYFSEKIALAGKAEYGGGEDFVITPNEYRYPYSFQLPNELPASFEGNKGNIRYKMKGQIIKEAFFSLDKIKYADFTVVGRVDLNEIPDALNRQSNEDSKTVCCCCCESDPIVASLSIEKKGYVPGEAVVMHGEVRNGSNRTIGDCHISLEQRSVFVARRKGKGKEHVKEYRVTVAKTDSIEIQPGETVPIGGRSFQVPPLPPSDIPLCDFIDIYYQVILKAVPNGPALNLDVPLDIIIGTIPLKNQFEACYGPLYQPFSTGFSNTSGKYGVMTEQPSLQPRMDSLLLQPTAPPNDGIPPPSYDECVYETNLYSKNQEASGWRPAYPFYDWSKHPTP